MMAARLALRRAALGVALAAAACAHALAGDFYADKTVTMIVGFAPGGGVDTGARLVARHLPSFIPGKPSIVVQNMPGAAGIIAANHIYARAAPDGLTLAMPGREWPVERALQNPGARFDPLKLAWIGSTGATNDIAWVRADTGVRSVEDLKRPRAKVIFGALGRNTQTASVPMLLAAQGLAIAVVPGYDATASILLALEKNEVSGIFTNEASFARRHDLVDRGVVLPILQSEPRKAGLPLLRDIVAAKEQPLLAAVTAPERFGLPLVGPPGMPPDRVAILRKAFMGMASDASFRREAEQLGEPNGFPIEGAALARMIAEVIGAMTPQVVAAYSELTQRK